VPFSAALCVTQNVISQLKSSLILLVFLGVLFSIPIVTVGYSVHGPDLALLAALAVMILVFIGPLSFFFASSITTDLELILIVIFGAALFISWVRALAHQRVYYVPYLPVIGWALMGAYFFVSLFFAHATT
jgi:hypothetical protein